MKQIVLLRHENQYLHRELLDMGNRVTKVQVQNEATDAKLAAMSAASFADARSNYDAQNSDMAR